MEKFIFYKGKYYTKESIQTLHEMCEYSIGLAEQKHALYMGVCKKFMDYCHFPLFPSTKNGGVQE